MRVSLRFENIDFILESIINFLLFFHIQRSINTPRDLSILLEVHVEEF